MAVFTTEERQGLRDELVSVARADARITAAALTGSAATGREDRWSDIDLALAVADDADLGLAMADWTDRMYRKHGAIDHVDVTRGRTVYRVFLLGNTLQVDLAFSPAAQFGAVAPTFQLIFGVAQEQQLTTAPAAAELIGLGWLYALHARSSIARDRVWQAEYMISGVRDHVLALACLRHGLPVIQGRGIDRLPPDVTAAAAAALVVSLEAAEIRRAFGVISEALLAETAHADADLAGRLAGPLRELAGLSPPDAGAH